MSGLMAAHARRRGPNIPSFFKAHFSTLPILHEDEHILAISKPSGMSVHGGAGVRNQETVIGQLNASASRAKLFLVHRLDAGTTGALVLAKSKDVARLLERAFSASLVKKTYTAAVVSEQSHARWKQTGTICDEIAGKSATTGFTTISRGSGPCRLLELTPSTGRTHQLRIHCAKSLGAPILGDSKYGRTRVGGQRDVLDRLSIPQRNSPPLFLHCATLRVPLIKETPRRISLEPALFTRIDAPLPDHFLGLQRFLDS